MSTPSSIINVCSGVLLNNDYLHTIWFNNQSEQVAYFAEKVVKTFSAYTYIRKSWSIKVEATMEQARSWSYLFFKNGNGKTYFYFINQIEYINDHTVELFIEMDVMQTYMHEYVLHPCFVEREHSATDFIGEHTQDEGLDLGELIVQDAQSITQLRELCILVQATINPETKARVLGSVHHRVFSGMATYAVKLEDVTAWASVLRDLSDGYIDSIVNMWMYPKELVLLADGFDWDDTNLCKVVSGVYKFGVSATKKDVLDDSYVPENNKLLCYPYNFLYVTNNAGGSAVYQYERFANDTCEFTVSGAISPDGAVKLWPEYYKGASDNYDEGITINDYPTCAWNADMYKLWLAQNRNTQNLAMGTGLAMMAGGAVTTLATGGIGGIAGLGTFVSGLSQVTSLLAQRKDMEIQPPQARGAYSASVNVAQNYHTFTMQFKSITKEMARKIDNFFSVYGYKCGRVKVPNRNVREKWTYTKTVDCHVSGNLCTEDLRKIQSIYDKGITFWKDGDLIGNYVDVDGFIINPCL